MCKIHPNVQLGNIRFRRRQHLGYPKRKNPLIFLREGFNHKRVLTFKTCGKGWNRTTDTNVFWHSALPTELPFLVILYYTILLISALHYFMVSPTAYLLYTISYTQIISGSLLLSCTHTAK